MKIALAYVVVVAAPFMIFAWFMLRMSARRDTWYSEKFRAG